MIPNETDPRWERVLTSESNVSSASLATKILISRLRIQVKLNPNALTPAINEFRSYFLNNDFARADVEMF